MDVITYHVSKRGHWWQNHNKTKHNKAMSILYGGIYCIYWLSHLPNQTPISQKIDSNNWNLAKIIITVIIILMIKSGHKFAHGCHDMCKIMIWSHHIFPQEHMHFYKIILWAHKPFVRWIWGPLRCEQSDSPHWLSIILCAMKPALWVSTKFSTL